MKRSVERLYDRYYPLTDGRRYRDSQRPFYEWMLAHLETREAKVLDVGAGPEPDAGVGYLRGKVKRLVGVDLDPAVLGNDGLDEAYVNDGVHLPFPDSDFDAVYSDWTLEHVAQPEILLAEIQRVLKPRSSHWLRTPNRSHYVTAVAAHTPHWFHRLMAQRVRGIPIDSQYPWRTYYRANTPRTLKTLMRLAGFSELEIRLWEPSPHYLVFSSAAFRFGIAYERLVNRFQRLAGFRQYMLVRATKSPSRPV
jgi:ubiquinone/menaquinone biosynthesis C-methylase UbiE